MAKDQSEALFEESSRGAVGVVTAVLFVLSMVLMLGGMVIMSFGVNPELGAAEIWTFIGGLAVTALGFFIPFAALPATGK